MDGLQTPSKIDLQYADSTVLFSICDCSLNKKYSFWNIDRLEAEAFLKRLRHIQNLTWKQFANLPREVGLTSENPTSKSFEMIHDQNTSTEKIMEQYYFHFRVEPKGLFRVFGYQKGRLFCITHLDVKGEIHH